MVATWAFGCYRHSSDGLRLDAPSTRREIARAGVTTCCVVCVASNRLTAGQDVGVALPAQFCVFIDLEGPNGVVPHPSQYSDHGSPAGLTDTESIQALAIRSRPERKRVQASRDRGRLKASGVLRQMPTLAASRRLIRSSIDPTKLDPWPRRLSRPEMACRRYKGGFVKRQGEAATVTVVGAAASLTS